MGPKNREAKAGRAASGEAKDDHPFFCRKKQCRKTAWETPEYLTAADLKLLEELDGVGSEGRFHDVVFSSAARAEGFFYRVIGWPEGLSYMRGSLQYREQTGWPAVKPLIERALLSLEGQGQR